MLLERVGKYLDLDSRIKLGLTPRRLDPKIIFNLETKFPRPVMVYLSDTKTIFNFSFKFREAIGILRPLTLDYLEDDLAMFNLDRGDWVYEVITDGGCCHVRTMTTPWCTELKIKIADLRDEGEGSGSSS